MNLGLNDSQCSVTPTATRVKSWHTDQDIDWDTDSDRDTTRTHQHSTSIPSDTTKAVTPTRTTHTRPRHLLDTDREAPELDREMTEIGGKRLRRDLTTDKKHQPKHDQTHQKGVATNADTNHASGNPPGRDQYSRHRPELTQGSSEGPSNPDYWALSSKAG